MTEAQTLALLAYIGVQLIAPLSMVIILKMRERS